MARGLKHIFLLVAATVILTVSCKRDEAEVIPRSKLAKIYAEMLVTDQWINTTAGVRRIADTSLVYEPILEKYGYDSKDYRKSVDHYMNDPERFARILRTSGELLDKRIAELKTEQKRLEEKSRLPVVKSDFHVGDFVPYLADEPYVHFYDSLHVELDTALMYRMVSLERADTIYDRVRMIIVDSLYLDDSLPRLETILAADSLLTVIGADSLRRLRTGDAVKEDTVKTEIGKLKMPEVKPVRSEDRIIRDVVGFKRGE